MRADDLKLLRKREQERISVVPGRSEAIYGPAHGFSKTYVFGTQLFELWMEDADAELLVGERAHKRDRMMFRDVTETAGSPGPLPLGDDWQDVDTTPPPTILVTRA